MRLLLVGWDAADWKVIDPLLASGEMPHLAGVIAGGVRGNIATLYPALSPMLWTSIATGKRPPRHGIHGFTEPSPDGMSVRPIGNLARTTKAVWNILNQNGKRCLVAGWWPSHPAEPIRGAMVSNHFAPPTHAAVGAPIAPGTVWPPAWEERLAGLRVHGLDITGEMLRMFAPDYDQVNQKADKSIHDLAGLIAETMSIHGAATELIEHEPWDLAAVYYTGIDHFSHRFMRHHAGMAKRGPHDSAPELFQEIVRNAYRFHDAMLGRLLELAGPGAAVMVLSDHGFHSDRLLPDYIPAEAAGPAVEHRHFGIFCLRAPGVHAGKRIYGASVLDVAPTVLHLFGLSAAQDMDGKVLINAFRDTRMPPAIPSWDDVPGEDGRHPPGRQYDSEAGAEALKQLVALGYVAPLGDDARRNVDECITENRYNLARAWMDAGRPDQAAELLRGLIATNPEEGRFYIHLMQCLMQQGQLARAGTLLAEFDKVCAAAGPRAARELRRRREQRPDNQLSREREGPDRREAHERRELAEKAGGFSVARMKLRCRLALAGTRKSKNRDQARVAIEEFAANAKARRGSAAFLAESFASLGEDERALEYARRARRTDREDWQMASLEARIHQQAGRYAQAADAAIESLSLVYFQPAVHYLLGVSLRRLGDDSRAADEFRVALAQAPCYPAAHDQLARILRKTPGGIGQASLHMAQAAELRNAAKQRKAPVASGPIAPSAGLPFFERIANFPPANRDGFVVVVAGLPRSGTSMMMQMLAAGGLEIFTDGERLPDSDNPRGYFEHRQATELYQDQSWIPQARGKAVKVVAQLLPHLPAGERYRIVFMHRPLEEVVASQRAMLERLGRTGAGLTAPALMRAYTQQMVAVQTWLHMRPEIPVLAVSYADALRDSASLAARLAAFVGAPFDAAGAAAAVDSSLRRQRHQMAS